MCDSAWYCAEWKFTAGCSWMSAKWKAERCKYGWDLRVERIGICGVCVCVCGNWWEGLRRWTTKENGDANFKSEEVSHSFLFLLSFFLTESLQPFLFLSSFFSQMHLDLDVLSLSLLNHLIISLDYIYFNLDHKILFLFLICQNDFLALIFNARFFFLF